MIIGICIGFVVGVLTMVIAFIVGERFRVMEARRFVAEDIKKHEKTSAKNPEPGEFNTTNERSRLAEKKRSELTGAEVRLLCACDFIDRTEIKNRHMRGLNKCLVNNAQKSLDEIAQLTADIAEARQMNEDFLSGHFCPNPQLSKLASTCDCAHSDRHRKMDWETIDGLTKVLEKIAKNKDATEYYDEIITGGFTQMPDIAKHLVNQIGREADDALQRKKPESRRPNGTIVNSK